MPSGLRLVQRWLPLLLAAFFALSIVQVASQLGLSLAGIDLALRRGAAAYRIVAAAGLAAVLLILAAEVWAGPAPGRPMPALLRLLTGRQAETVLPFETIDAAVLAASLKTGIIGQDGVCDEVALLLRRRLAMMRRDKPLGVFLLAGPPGTGKTLLAKRLAAALGRPLLPFDMSQFGAPHAATALFGAPPGYSGSERYGALTGGLRQSPRAVVLLDEIEKAHPDVLKRFLVGWNDGAITEASDGARLACSQALFVLTSNAATAALTEAAEIWHDRPDRLRQDAVVVLREAGFASEVLDRVDGIAVFRALDAADIEAVAELEVQALVRSFGLEVTRGDIDQAILFDIMRSQLRRDASARDIARAAESRVSDALIDARASGTRRIRLTQTADGRVIAAPA